MQFGLRSLVHSELAGHVEESRAFYAARGERRGPASLEELQEARARSVVSPLPGAATVEQIVDASGRQIPLRVLMPKNTKVRGVYRYLRWRLLHGLGSRRGCAQSAAC